MKCLHCLSEFHPNKSEIYIAHDVDNDWGIFRYDCPACNRTNLFLVNGNHVLKPSSRFIEIINQVPIHPLGSNRLPCPPEVPPFIAEDYREACLVLPFSPKASAALSRRCVQNLLRDAAKIKPGNLSDEIQNVIESNQLPSHLSDEIDSIRNIGNFAAHPMKSVNTGEILAVEPQEAEWNLDVLEGLFDFYYVRPAIAAKKKEKLNEKLREAGKPMMK